MVKYKRKKVQAMIYKIYINVKRPINMIATSWAGIAYTSGAADSHQVFSGVHVDRSFDIYVDFVDHCLDLFPFIFDHIDTPNTIYMIAHFPGMVQALILKVARFYPPLSETMQQCIEFFTCE
jgi:hypothetical protein